MGQFSVMGDQMKSVARCVGPAIREMYGHWVLMPAVSSRPFHGPVHGLIGPVLVAIRIPVPHPAPQSGIKAFLLAATKTDNF